MTRVLRGWVPPTVWLRLRRWWLLPLELGDRLCGGRDPLLPPRWLRSAAGGDFTAVGDRFLAHCRDLAGLQPTERVLEVGCGVGRVARGLTTFLTPPGAYEGFDVLAPAVHWCQRHVTPRFPHFRFRHVDLCNGGYNPRGRLRAEDFTFPYPDSAFDLVVLASVCTHLLPGAVERYLAEAARVLRPGGRVLATFFLLNADARARMAGPGSRFHFAHPGPGYWTTRPDRPETAVAYAEEDVRRWLARVGLVLREPINFGNWCGRSATREGQDVLVAVKNR
jgi:SAM-dependent methyltransferase